MTSPRCEKCDTAPSEINGLCVSCFSQQRLDFIRQRIRGAPPVEEDQLELLLARWSLPATTNVEWRLDKGEAFDERFRGYEVELRLIQPIGQALFYPWQIDATGKPGQVAEGSGEIAITTQQSERTAILRMRIWREPRNRFLEG